MPEPATAAETATATGPAATTETATAAEPAATVPSGGPAQRPASEAETDDLWPRVPRQPSPPPVRPRSKPEPEPEPDSGFESWLAEPVPRRPGRDRARDRALAARVRRIRARRSPRRPAVGLAALLVLALLTAFLAWVSAEPLWLALGHQRPGTATVIRCAGEGYGQGCVGVFTSADGAFTVEEVRLLGLDAADRHSGAVVAARMVSADGRGAYAADEAGLHLRWAIGLALVLACGLGIALTTGATRLPGRRARGAAVALSLAAPLLLFAGFLAASF